MEFGNKRILIVYTSIGTQPDLLLLLTQESRHVATRRPHGRAPGGPPCFEEAIPILSRIPWGTQFSQAFGTQASFLVHARINCTGSRTRSGSDRRFTFYTIRRVAASRFGTSELLGWCRVELPRWVSFGSLFFWVRFLLFGGEISNVARWRSIFYGFWFFIVVFQFRKL